MRRTADLPRRLPKTLYRLATRSRSREGSEGDRGGHRRRPFDATCGKHTYKWRRGMGRGQADCNTVLGTYTTTGSGGLTIVLGPSPIVPCAEGSLSDLYVLGLGNTASYAIANNQLTITLADQGTLVYK